MVRIVGAVDENGVAYLVRLKLRHRDIITRRNLEVLHVPHLTLRIFARGHRLADLLHTLLMRGAAVAQCVLHDFSFEGRSNIARMPSRT